MRTPSLAVLCFLICVSATLAFQEKAAASYMLGNVEIRPRGLLNSVYDDNIGYTKNNVKADYRQDLGFGFDVNHAGKTAGFGFSGNITRHMYNKNSELNNTAEDATMNAYKELSQNDRINLTDAFIHAVDPWSFEDQFGRINAGISSYYRNTLGGQYTREITKQFTMIAGYTNSFNAYSRKDQIDSSYNLASVEGDYAITSKTIILGYYQFLSDKYERVGNVNSSRISGGFRQYFTNQLYFDGRLGEDFIRTIDKQDTTGQYMSATLSNDIDANTRLSLAYTKQTAATYYSFDLFKSNQVSFSFVRQLLQRLVANFTSFYGQGKYTAVNEREDTVGASLGMTYELTERLKATVSYSYSHKTSNAVGNEYRKNVALFGLKYDF